MNMRTIRHFFWASCVAAVLALGMPLLVVPASAQSRPKNATAQCKDGTYSTAKTKQGACSKHGGVATWFADEKAPTTGSPKGPTPTPKETAPAPAAPKTPATKSDSAAPANATARCKDGTFSFAKQHRGACSHHGGVAEWFK
jgi:hypothetical protein